MGQCCHGDDYLINKHMQVLDRSQDEELVVNIIDYPIVNFGN